jgi:hypothetical protein
MVRLTPLGLVVALSLAAASFAADVITQTNAEGKTLVIQRDCIVIHQDSSAVVYKHFDLAERRVVKARLEQGSLPYEVDLSSPSERRQIVERWREFGYRVVVTDLTGKSTLVDDAYIDFYPPGGHGSLLEALPALTSFPIQLDGGGADSIEFSDIARVDMSGGSLKITERNGKVESGKFLMPTRLPAEARLLGITDHYDPASDEVFDFSLPLTRIKTIQFEP